VERYKPSPSVAIKVVKLTDAYPGAAYTTPDKRACLLAYAALDYLKACMLVMETLPKTQEPLFNFLLPTMHQTLELLTKALAFTVDAGFNPRRFSHNVLKLVETYEQSIPLFASMIRDAKTVQLLEELEKSYLGVRYGECALMYDAETWELFVQRANELLDELRARTRLRFV